MHQFYPALHTTNLYEGPLADFSFDRCITPKLDSFAVVPAVTDKHREMLTLIADLKKLVPDQTSDTAAGLDRLSAYVREQRQSAEEEQPIAGLDAASRKELNNRLRRYLLSTDPDLLSQGTRAISDFVNLAIAEVVGREQPVHGYLNLSIPVTEAMIPGQDTVVDSRAQVLRVLSQLFDKAWDTR